MSDAAGSAGPVKFGIAIGAYSAGVPSGRELADFARTAEAVGFDSVQVGDHIQWHAPILEATVLLATLAAATTRARIASDVVILPLRDPVLIAKTVASLDVAAARAFHAKALVPNDAIFSVSGDVAAADVIERIRTAFGGWRRGEVGDPGPAPPDPAPAQRRILVVDRKDLVQARIIVGHEGIARTDEHRIETLLMSLVEEGQA